jgi:hypothetical protein
MTTIEILAQSPNQAATKAAVASADASNTYVESNPDQTVTISGCVQQGVECLLLAPFKGNENYSLVSGSKVEIGSAYRITGTIVDVSICQQGKAIKPTTITKLDKKCS